MASQERNAKLYGFRLNPELEKVFLNICKVRKQKPYHVARLAIIELARRWEEDGTIESTRKQGIRKTPTKKT